MLHNGDYLLGGTKQQFVGEGSRIPPKPEVCNYTNLTFDSRLFCRKRWRIAKIVLWNDDETEILRRDRGPFILNILFYQLNTVLNYCFEEGTSHKNRYAPSGVELNLFRRAP